MFKKISIVIVLAIVFITSCKKYPDGPFFNFESKQKRILGYWYVDYFSIDGYDSTSYLQAQPYYGHFRIYAEKDYKDKIDLFFESKDPTIAPTPNYNLGGRCGFANNKKSLHWHLDTYLGWGQGSCGPFRALDVTWRIMRLTDLDLWLKTTYNDKEYYMKLKH